MYAIMQGQKGPRMPHDDVPTLNERINSLCAKAIATPDSPELTVIFQELREVLHLHVEELRSLPARYAGDDASN